MNIELANIANREANKYFHGNCIEKYIILLEVNYGL
jgi:hypothetical protein